MAAHSPTNTFMKKYSSSEQARPEIPVGKQLQEQDHSRGAQNQGPLSGAPQESNKRFGQQRNIYSSLN